MKYNAEAYYEGLKCGRYGTNTYQECSDGFDNYEKGVTQRLKWASSDELDLLLKNETTLIG